MLSALAGAMLIALPAPDVEATLAADRMAASALPHRIAVAMPAGHTAALDGHWSLAENGAWRWTLEYQVSGARHLSVALLPLQLPAGVELHVESADGRDRHGPYSRSDVTAEQLWTPAVRGDHIRLTAQVPAHARDGFALTVARVHYGFRGLFAAPEDKLQPCHVDVACSEADPWQDELRSVAMISIAGVASCSGTLLNNTAQDLRPYFLTAKHCVHSPAEAAATVFYWNFENSSCGGDRDGRLTQASSGARYVAGSLYEGIEQDYALLELTQRPPEDYEVYYAGWDRRAQEPVGVVGIHHPAGEEKRISIDPDKARHPDNNLPEFMSGLLVDSWELGTTEPGSSGSGLWNQSRHVVGMLSSGASDASCGAERNSYSRFDQAWHGRIDGVTGLAPHLDPLGLGVDTLDGVDPRDLAKSTPARGRTQAQAGALGGLSVLVALVVAAFGFSARSAARSGTGTRS